jgi:hypothetical protein
MRTEAVSAMVTNANLRSAPDMRAAERNFLCTIRNRALNTFTESHAEGGRMEVVPLSIPVLLFRDMPVGNDPEAIENVYAPEPPDTMTLAVYGSP